MTMHDNILGCTPPFQPLPLVEIPSRQDGGGKLSDLSVGPNRVEATGRGSQLWVDMEASKEQSRAALEEDILPQCVNI